MASEEHKDEKKISQIFDKGMKISDDSSEADEDEERISQIFDKGMNIFDDLSKTSEATNSSTIQVSVRNTVYKYHFAVNI
jgi:hypothetical protein